MILIILILLLLFGGGRGYYAYGPRGGPWHRRNSTDHYNRNAPLRPTLRLNVADSNYPGCFPIGS
jgi:hypothetical protein